MSDFDEFDQTYGPAQECEHPSAEDIAAFEGRLPEELLERWRTVGRCSYGDRLLWMTDPKQLDDVVADWLKAFELEPGPVFLRTAFAHLYVWSGGNVVSIDVQQGQFSRVTTDIKLFFSLLPDADLQEKILRRPLYEEVKGRLGPPERDECYAFVPALALGGPGTADTVQRVKLREQLGILAALVLEEA